MADLVRFHPQIPDDLAAAIAWYTQISPAIANRFRVAIKGSFSRIHEQPLVYGQLFDDVRCIRVQGFPYLIQYRLRDETPFVLGVFHSGSNPRRWRERSTDAR